MVQPEGQTYPSCVWVVPKKRVISNKQRTTNDAISGLPNITSLAAGGGNGALSLDALAGFPLAADLLTICRPIYRDPTNQRWKLNVLQLYRPVRRPAHTPQSAVMMQVLKCKPFSRVFHREGPWQPCTASASVECTLPPKLQPTFSALAIQGNNQTGFSKQLRHIFCFHPSVPFGSL